MSVVSDILTQVIMVVVLCAMFYKLLFGNANGRSGKTEQQSRKNRHGERSQREDITEDYYTADSDNPYYSQRKKLEGIQR